MEKLRIIVGGYIGLLPAGGITWDYIQYPLGLALLGHDVYYIEDTRLFPIYQKPGSAWNDASSCVEHLNRVMEYFGLADRWAYRDEASGKSFGLSEKRIKEICKTADVFINISCSTTMREEYACIPARVLIDSDPMFTQIQYASEQKFTPGVSTLRDLVHQHNYLFTFGENIGSPDCRIPVQQLNWNTTRQPVCLNYWKQFSIPDKTVPGFTTLMNWTAAKKLVYRDEEWGQKDIEFNKIIDLPSRIPTVNLSLVINQTGGTGDRFDQEAIKASGWNLLHPNATAGDWQQYQQFIQASMGEFSVAKNTYVKANTGWFSCRSACYLATGRPVVTQDTGWSKFIPSGKGLFAFSDENEAELALRTICSDITYHANEARKIAVEFFDSNKVLRQLLGQLVSTNIKTVAV